MIDIASITEKLWEAYSAIPWLGAFIVAFLGNTIPFATVPYLLFIILAAPSYRDPLTQLEVVVSAGVGAALGKLVVFMFGRAAHRVLPEHVKNNLEFFVRIIRKWGFIAVFLFAALPLPDDVLYIPLGVAGYSMLLFFIAVTLGKIVITAAALSAGNLIASFIGGGGLSPLYIATMIALSIYVTLVIARVDWMRVAKAMEKGLMPAMQVLMEELKRAIIPVSNIRLHEREVRGKP